MWNLLRDLGTRLLRDLTGGSRERQELLAAQVDAQRQANESLAADIAEGTTPEKMEELAREELGLVTPGEYVFYDVSN